MHILEIPSFFTPYGGEFCLEQAKALKALGHEVRILSNVQLGITIGGKDFLVLPSCRFEHERDGITIYQSYQRGLPRMVHHNVMRWVDIVCSMFTEYVAKYGKPDILHAHCAKWAGYAAMQIRKQYDIPYVITEHLPKDIFKLELGEAPTTAWQVPLLKETYHQADMVITVSEELVDDLACYFGRDYRHVAIPNMIDTRFYSFSQRKPVIDRAFSFCCPAIFNHRKGYDVLFEALAQLTETEPNVVLHIAGMGTDSKACRQMIKRYGVQDKVICHGRIDANEMRALYDQSDALVMASRSEAQPLVLLEAMSTGIPVIATTCVPKSVRIEGGCTVVPVDNAEALCVAMKQVMACEFDGKTVSDAVKRMSAPQVVAQKLENLFNRIIA
jgi:glycosyltransferase involved in cell wall biosynthesis